MMPMSPDDWRHEVSQHLEMIEAGAEMCARHANQLNLRPAFETKAEAELDRCENVLRKATQRLEEARAAYRSKTTTD